MVSQTTVSPSAHFPLDLPNAALSLIWGNFDLADLQVVPLVCKQFSELTVEYPPTNEQYTTFFFNSLECPVVPGLSLRMPQDMTWPQFLASQRECWLELSKMESPGCSIQKYLRWLQGVPAHAPVVRQAIFGASLLPEAFHECFTHRPDPDGKSYILVKTTSPIKLFMYLIDSHHRTHRPPSSDELASMFTAQFNPARYLQILRWMPEHDERLRQLMAEVQQIIIRGVNHFITEEFLVREDYFCLPPLRREDPVCRQVSALSTIHELAQCCDENVRYWAARH